ncbi:MAG: DUF4857 domain-containing protein [Campylobacter sp.]|nr:DUF4857 domain-containing protein [Campylobacter sp.]
MKFLNLFVTAIFSLLLSYFLPIFINLILPENQIVERVRYSPVIDDFMLSSINRADNTNTFEIIGKSAISEDEFIQNQPFTYSSILIAKGKFPSKFKEYENNTTLILKNSQFLNLRPSVNLTKNIPLYVFLQTDEKYGRLKYMPFLIRLGNENGLQIINVDTNKIDENLSSNLNEIFNKSGFKFPAKQYFSNPTTLKPFDEGSFIVDSADGIFHLKFDGWNFILQNTKLVKKDIINIVVSENERREFYALLIAKDELGLIGYDYKFIPLPYDGYDPIGSNLSLRINPVNKILSFASPQNIHTYVMDLNYTKLKHNVMKTSKPANKRYLKEYILPFELKLAKDSHFYKLQIDKFNVKSIFLSVALALAFFVYNFAFFKKKRFLSATFIAMFGIYGLIAVILYATKKE